MLHPDPFGPYEDEIAALEREVARLKRGVDDVVKSIGEKELVDGQLVVRLLRSVTGS